MAGYREFQTGEVLTAANVNDFLGKQAVMKFADAAARNTALGTAVGGANALREGMVAYLDDTNELQTFDGTAWGAVGGGLVAVKSALFTGTQTNSTAAGANFAVTDLSITHTLADSSNKLIISAYIGAGNGSSEGLVGLAVADGGTLIGVGDADGSRSRVGAGGKTIGGSNTLAVTMPSVTFVYAPGDTASHTYTVQAINMNTTTRTIYINRSEDNTDNEARPRAASALVIQEVKV